MLYFFSCVLVLSIIFFLVLFYHLYTWNLSVSFLDSSRVWVSPFECGFLGNVLVENVFSYTYFILLVFFVIFDLEISLLVNIPYEGQLFKNFSFYFFFIFILVLGYTLEVSKGYVSWNY
uniref:NADH-ubiquinone oxidoreductase chain 3 n=1 Tax=Diplostomum spathaceum TaxID=183647 RepID=A0A2H4W8T9_9TREM|nr:NADH dehydrogenase subunit 3 [Diplostomum spathaceum]AUC63436.1 NADH dehydrogenase subunit 3 [Diplostomum spathaceum]AUC63438.1 NADH dehydrogenase subunit 3 [Diplostomum spathaceum]AUC63440.1 NADH dehydrogenase subunit 3 [Diplostomum spathaceum]